MSEIGNLMRSASNELNQYILAENERLAATVHGQMETPPDYHDQQTCYELQIEARAVDTLTARVAELEAVLCEISNMCVGNLAMSYSLDAEHIGQSIYEATGMSNPELNNSVKEKAKS